MMNILDVCSDYGQSIPKILRERYQANENKTVVTSSQECQAE